MYGNQIEYLFVLANISRFVMHILSLPSNREIFIIKKKKTSLGLAKLFIFQTTTQNKAN